MPIDDDDDEGELIECREGCGRRFKPKALEKHEKVCRKVFQSKRKAFNTAEQRKVDELAELERNNKKKGPFGKKKPSAA